ncbi:MAG: GNAT family N-acetyltransferase [Pseudomonadota bacterium]
MLIVEEADPRAPGPRALLEASHALMQETFPPEDNYFLNIDELCASGVVFFAARDRGTTLGTGALAIKQDYAEVKSMFTAPEARGRGVAAAILRALDDAARARNVSVLKLETGDLLKSAVRLYERAGFTRCAIFGDYAPNASSVYMEKPLT